MGGDRGGIDIKTALLTEGRIARDDCSSDRESRHVIFDDFFGVRQCLRNLRAKMAQYRTKLLWRSRDVGVVRLYRHHAAVVPGELG